MIEVPVSQAKTVALRELKIGDFCIFYPPNAIASGLTIRLADLPNSGIATAHLYGEKSFTYRTFQSDAEFKAMRIPVGELKILLPSPPRDGDPELGDLLISDECAWLKLQTASGNGELFMSFADFSVQREPPSWRAAFSSWSLLSVNGQERFSLISQE